MERIKETVVVEGKDDKARVLSAVEANVLCTSGWGLNEHILSDIRDAYEKTGIIIFTDPDHAGRKTREKLLGYFPDAKQAFLTRAQAEKDGDIGIENADPEDIVRALTKVGSLTFENTESITIEDLQRLGLSGFDDSSSLREACGKTLGIGYANTKSFLKRLNFMGISLEKLEAAAEDIKKNSL